MINCYSSILEQLPELNTFTQKRKVYNANYVSVTTLIHFTNNCMFLSINRNKRHPQYWLYYSKVKLKVTILYFNLFF